MVVREVLREKSARRLLRRRTSVLAIPLAGWTMLVAQSAVFELEYGGRDVPSLGVTIAVGVGSILLAFVSSRPVAWLTLDATALLQRGDPGEIRPAPGIRGVLGLSNREPAIVPWCLGAGWLSLLVMGMMTILLFTPAARALGRGGAMLIPLVALLVAIHLAFLLAWAAKRAASGGAHRERRPRDARVGASG